MKQLILNACTGKNLQYPLEYIADFIVTHTDGEFDSVQSVNPSLDEIFTANNTISNFILLGLNTEDELIAVMVVKENQEKEHVISYFAIDDAVQGKPIGESMLRSGMKLCRGQVKLQAMMENQTKEIFHEYGFSQRDTYMYLYRE